MYTWCLCSVEITLNNAYTDLTIRRNEVALAKTKRLASFFSYNYRNINAYRVSRECACPKTLGEFNLEDHEKPDTAMTVLKRFYDMVANCRTVERA